MKTRLIIYPILASLIALAIYSQSLSPIQSFNTPQGEKSYKKVATKTMTNKTTSIKPSPTGTVIEFKAITKPNDSILLPIFSSQFLNKLTLDPDKIEAKKKVFKNDQLLFDWQEVITSKLGQQKPEQKAAIKENQLLMLTLGELLREAYIWGDIDFAEYIENQKSLFKWHQETFASLLNEQDYLTLFEVNRQETEEIIETALSSAAAIDIRNQWTSEQQIRETLDDYKYSELREYTRQKILAREILAEQVDNGEIDPEEAVDELLELDNDYINECKVLLEEEEFKMLFGKGKEEA